MGDIADKIYGHYQFVIPAVTYLFFTLALELNFHAMRSARQL